MSTICLSFFHRLIYRRMAKKRKTRKDKIIADLKRELTKKKPTNPKPIHIASNLPVGGSKLPKSSPISTNTNSQINLYLKKDLTKSLALAILVIVFELVVYWQLR